MFSGGCDKLESNAKSKEDIDGESATKCTLMDGFVVVFGSCQVKDQGITAA
jgi:hypothetical protein